MPNDPPPDQKPDLQPPKSDWLHTVARATYGSVFGGDQAQLLAIYLASRRSLALAAAGDDAGSALARTAAEAQARRPGRQPRLAESALCVGPGVDRRRSRRASSREFDAAAACDATFLQRRTAALALLERLMNAQ